MTPACRVAALALTLCLAGCASTPSSVNGGGSGGSGPQLIVTMTVAHEINPNDFYFVLINNANDPTGANGPVPVVQSPWGNGFATGNGANAAGLTHYIGNYPLAGQVSYGLYAAVAGTQGRQFTYLGQPLQVNIGTNTLQFRIALSQLGIAAGTRPPLQINLLTTDTVPQDPNYPGTKHFDALGQSDTLGALGSYVTIPTAQSAIYQNSDKLLEPTGDVAEAGNGTYRTVTDPDLDITDWRIEVRD